MHYAVPLIGRSISALQHVQVSPIAVERLAVELLGIPLNSSSSTHSKLHQNSLVPALECRFRFADDDDSVVPLLFVGGSSGASTAPSNDDGIYYALADGLPGAVALTHSEFLEHLPYVSSATCRYYSTDELTSSISLMDAKHQRISYLRHPLHEAIAAAMDQTQPLEDAMLSTPPGAGHLLRELAFVTRKRAATLRGLEQILAIGSSLTARHLSMDFSYHCGTQDHAIKRYFDISGDIAGQFLAPLTFHDGRFHGAKVLSRYGSAVYVGCTVDEDMDCVSPFWHPLGSATAQSAPLFQPPATSTGGGVLRPSPQVLEVGWHKLDINGPLSSSALLQSESLSRYMTTTGNRSEGDDGIDASNWLNVGLFGRAVGSKYIQALPEGLRKSPAGQTRTSVVAGVRHNTSRNALEQIGVVEGTGDIVILP
ncbi:Hypothetical protein, putative [Bodo saltans]|uniref:Uncharacterized protein n=1 Tax=Bodo saltans TaxID=75058 RepID=A0A0S4ITH9_BODSA|nr:Hypothetical protein, putative [Bodo saltans]|eukprot:CUF84703.1 Hypothetical protein, putative [Bodo saltans]